MHRQGTPTTRECGPHLYLVLRSEMLKGKVNGTKCRVNRKAGNRGIREEEMASASSCLCVCVKGWSFFSSLIANPRVCVRHEVYVSQEVVGEIRVCIWGPSEPLEVWGEKRARKP